MLEKILGKKDDGQAAGPVVDTAKAYKEAGKLSEEKTVKTPPKKPIKIGIDWKEISEGKGDERATIISRELRHVDYVSLTDLLTRRKQGSAHVMKMLDIQHGCQNGQQRPTTSGHFRLKPFKPYPVEGAEASHEYDYKPGETVTWHQQDYYRMPLGDHKGLGEKKLTQADRNDIIMRGEGHMLTDNGKAVVDKHGFITVGYYDAIMLLNRSGFKRLPNGSTVSICNKQLHTSRQVRHQTELNKVVLQTRRNWLFCEINPWEDPASKWFKAEIDKDTKHREPKDDGVQPLGW